MGPPDSATGTPDGAAERAAPPRGAAGAAAEGGATHAPGGATGARTPIPRGPTESLYTALGTEESPSAAFP